MPVPSSAAAEGDPLETVLDDCTALPERVARIAVVIPYFGSFPAYWPLTLATMGRNAFIDWHLYTDQRVSDAPANVVVHPTTFDAVAERARQAIGYDIALGDPYKLCDFKPAYGAIFADDLLGYDYFGYGDLDVVWGDLSTYLTGAVANGDERILTRGHLSLLRNTDRVRHAFRSEIPGLPTARAALTMPRTLQFDEFGGWWAIADGISLSTFDERVFYDIHVDAYRPQANRSRGQRTDTVFAWQDGKCLELDGRGEIVSEAGYIHLQKRPMRCDAADLSLDDVPAIFAFGPVDIERVPNLAIAATTALRAARSWSSKSYWGRGYVRFRARRAWRRARREVFGERRPA